MRDALDEQGLGNLHLELRDVAGGETGEQIVYGGQRRPGLAALVVPNALVDQRLGDRHVETQSVAGAKTRNQIVPGGQRRLGLAALVVRSGLVEYRHGNEYLELRGVAVGETGDQIVIGRQRRLGLASLAVGDALDEQRQGYLHLELRGVAGAVARDQVVEGGQLRLMLAALMVHDALVDQRLGNHHLEVQCVAGGQCPFESLANGPRLRSLRTPRANHLGQLVAAVEHRHELDEVAHQPGLVAFASQLVVDAVETFRGGVPPLPARPFRDDCAPVDQPRDQRRCGANVHAGSRRDLLGARRLPEVDHCEIDAALGLGEDLQMAAEVLGVVVDQRHQIFQEPAQRPMPCEGRDDDQQAGAATGQNPKGRDRAIRLLVAADHVPEAPAGIRIQRLQLDDPEQLEERPLRIVQSLEPTGRGGQQHDSRLRLQRLAKPPAEIIADVAAQGLQVLDHEDDPPVQPIGRLEKGGARTLLDVRVPPPGGQVGVGREELPGELRIAGRVRAGEVEQRFEPEVGEGGDLLALFHEPHGKQTLREGVVGPQLRADPSQQHGFSSTARPDDQHVLARRRIGIAAYDLQHEVELSLPDHELSDDLVIRLERARIELADRPIECVVHRSPLGHGRPRRSSRGT